MNIRIILIETGLTSVFSPFKRLQKDQISVKILSFIFISFFVINKSGDRNVS